MVEFLNTWHKKEDTMYTRIGEKMIVVDRHVIANAFKISNIGWKENKQVE
jgi:protein involved in temperature-dependent protein secretion